MGGYVAKANKDLQIIDAFLDIILKQRINENLDAKKYVELLNQRAKGVFKKIGIDIPNIPHEIIELRKLLGEESDRGCVLSAAAYLENELGKLLKNVLVQDEKLYKALFEGYGPLASFSARIDLAYGLGLIPPNERRDLHLIRKIRNTFAHRTGEVTFDDHDISSQCSELHHNVFDDNLTPRQKFIRVAIGAAAPIHVAFEDAKHPDKAKDIDIGDREFKELAKSLYDEICKTHRSKS